MKIHINYCYTTLYEIKYIKHIKNRQLLGEEPNSFCLEKHGISH